jgi:superfamily II DNA or RNA helicase
VVYSNRKLLVEQLQRMLTSHGIEFGVRASGHQDNRHLPVQIASLPTEKSRVLDRGRWQVHGNGHGGKVLALVDEAHLNAAGTAQAILGRHHAAGGVYVGLTATPIGLGHLYDSLVVAGTPSELRACGALVPAYHYGPDEPDMQKFKRNAHTREYREGDVRKAIMTKRVFGRVLEWWQKLNPEQRPTILFAPGVGESVWFAERFVQQGVPWAHLDGKNVWLDGRLLPTSQSLRDEVIGRLKDGTIMGISNRFVLREGIDIPEASHGIFATVMGSLQTWLQSAGRLLRAAPGKTLATIQDHGGMWHRHGSANVDRDWRLDHTETILAGLRVQRLQEKQEPEPIHCPACGLIRARGAACPKCGHVAERKPRFVVQTDGTLREQTGDIYRARVVRYHDDTCRLWTRCYYQAKNSKNRMSFNQAVGLFFRQHHYYPPRDLPLMPTSAFDWFLPVADVPVARLTGAKEGPCHG